MSHGDRPGTGYTRGEVAPAEQQKVEQLDGRTAFFLVCREAFRDGAVDPGENALLQALCRELSIENRDAARLAEAAKARAAARGFEAGAKFEPERVLLRAYHLVHVSPGKDAERVLAILETAMKFPPERARGLREKIAAQLAGGISPLGPSAEAFPPGAVPAGSRPGADRPGRAAAFTDLQAAVPPPEAEADARKDPAGVLGEAPVQAPAPAVAGFAAVVPVGVAAPAPAVKAGPAGPVKDAGGGDAGGAEDPLVAASGWTVPHCFRLASEAQVRHPRLWLALAAIGATTWLHPSVQVLVGPSLSLLAVGAACDFARGEKKIEIADVWSRWGDRLLPSILNGWILGTIAAAGLVLGLVLCAVGQQTRSVLSLLAGSVILLVCGGIAFRVGTFAMHEVILGRKNHIHAVKGSYALLGRNSPEVWAGIAALGSAVLVVLFAMRIGSGKFGEAVGRVVGQGGIELVLPFLHLLDIAVTAFQWMALDWAWAVLTFLYLRQTYRT